MIRKPASIAILATVVLAATVMLAASATVAEAQGPGQPGLSLGGSDPFGASPPGAQGQPAKAGGGTGSTRKIDSHLQELLADEAAGRDVVRSGRAEDLEVSAGERVLVDVYVDGDAAAAAALLRREGMDVRATSDRAPVAVVEGWLPLTAVPAAAALPVTNAVLAVSAGGVDAGATLSQGDAAHRGPQARALGPSGAGVTVGVISDSINQVGGGVAASQATGDLPAGVTVLSDDPGQSDEGRAMAEIIYDGAPGVSRFLFASGTATGPVGKANAIASLQANGAEVIADDIFYLSEPFFQDGLVSQAVDSARAAGVAYLASAGNRARQSYEATFTPGTGGFHDFLAGAGEDTTQTVTTVPNGAFIQLVLQWDEALGAAQTDLDAFLVRTSDGATLASDTTNDPATGIARATVTWSNTTGAAVQVGLRTQRFGGTRTPFMKYIARGNFGTFSIAEHNTSSDTINPDAASARGALAVAAVRHSEPGLNDPEPFSSRGPKTRLFDRNGVRLASPELRQKPEIAGADGVSTSVPGFNPFFGTSAATPSAAGVGALVLSAQPSVTTDDLYAIMQNPANAIDCTLAGNPDTDCGSGFVLADRVAAQGLDPTPPVVTPNIAASAPVGLDGWHRGNVTVTWSATDTGSPVTSTSGCTPTTVTADTPGTTSTCSAHSAGGTASQAVTIKRDTRAPSAPTFTGIRAGTYTRSRLPAASAVGCTATDATSGLAGCSVRGYSSAPGSHTLTATAVDRAGLAATSTLSYTVGRAPTITSLGLPRSIALGRMARRGVAARLRVTRGRTRLVAAAFAEVAGRGARSARRVRVGGARRTASRGRATIRVKLSARGKRLLRARRRTRLEIRVVGTSQGDSTTLRRNLLVRR